MQKFGLFDLIDKLAPLKKVIDGVNNFSQPPKKTEQEFSNNITEKPAKKANVQPVLSLIKRHNEISKRIDDKLKK